MLSGHLPPGSRLLVLAPDGRWREMLRARDAALFASWEVVRVIGWVRVGEGEGTR